MSQKLRETIDRMVEDAIRRILPEVMNEVLIKTIASANVIQERAPVQVRNEHPGTQQRIQQTRKQRPSSLSQLLDPEAGADFYNDPRAAMMEATREIEPAPRGQVVAQRIQSLPPALQGLAEGMDLDDDGGEMWDSEIGDSAVPTAGMGPPLDRAAQAVGLDFSRMQRSIQLTEKKSSKIDRTDQAAQAQFENYRLKMMRERLNGGKPVE